MRLEHDPILRRSVGWRASAALLAGVLGLVTAPGRVRAGERAVTAAPAPVPVAGMVLPFLEDDFEHERFKVFGPVPQSLPHDGCYCDNSTRAGQADGRGGHQAQGLQR